MRTGFFLAILFCCTSALAQTTEPTAQVGSFETTFELRSPHSEIKSLTRRLGEKIVAADYNPKDFDCLIHVPEKYSDKSPMGLVVLLNYKDSGELPGPVLSQFDDANCALVVPKKFDVPMVHRVGLALDIAHNMQSRYAINPTRIYVFGFTKDGAGARLGMSFPDVFTGAFLSDVEYYRSVNFDALTYPPSSRIPKPRPAALDLAKSHPFACGPNYVNKALATFATAMKQDGFKYVHFEDFPHERCHYPKYTTDWIPDLFKFLDDATDKLVIDPKAPSLDIANSAEPEAQVDSFTITFEERSPQSEINNVARQLGVTTAGADYKPKDFPCVAHVPENYAPKRPMGLVVMLTFGPSTELPEDVLPQFDAVNCALVVPTKSGSSLCQRAGIAIDIVHNMRQLYAIDPKRIYIFSFDREFAGQRLMLGFPDVFTGAFLFDVINYRPVKGKQGNVYPANLPKPEAKSFAAAKPHPIFIGTIATTPDRPLFANAMKEDGFKISFRTLTQKQIAYPAFTKDWVPEVFKFLDNGTAKLTIKPKPPATQSSK